MGRAKGQNNAVSVTARFDAAFSGGARRGTTAEPAAPAAAETVTSTEAQRARVIDQLGFGSLLQSRSTPKVIRSLKRDTFIADTEEWKRQENEFVDGVRADLEEGMLAFARDNKQWAAFQRMVARAPYSQLNELWGRIQLNRKWEALVEAGEDPATLGDPTDGAMLSKSLWHDLGAVVGDEYFKRKDGWDDRYTVELTKPLGWNGFTKETPVFDAVGNPVIDPETGQQKIKKSFQKTTPKGYGTFIAYHQGAMRTKEGEPFEMPQAPWQALSDPGQAAGQMLTDMQGVAKDEGVTLKFVPGSGHAHDYARYDAETKTITVDSAAPTVEQSVALLRALCEHVGADDYEPQDPDARERRHKARRAAAESAKYAVASLYGLDSSEQTFPHLAELASDEETGRQAVAMIASDTARRVQRILQNLDPVMRAKARSAGAERAAKKGRSSRAKSKSKPKTARK